MKKTILFFLITNFILTKAYTQILCVQCFNQNVTLEAGNFNLITNGGFENSTCIVDDFSHSFCPTSSRTTCYINNWICTGGGSSTYAQLLDTVYTYVPEGFNIAYFGNSFCTPCSNVSSDTSCLINTGCTVSGFPTGYPTNSSNLGDTTGLSLSQTVTGLTVGNTYLFEFWVGGENPGGSSYINSGAFALDIGFGKIYLRNKPTFPLNSIGLRYLVTFLATSSSHTFKFTNWGHICNTCTELMLDDVRLYTPQYVSPTITICTVGIDEQNENNITVSPVPVSDILTIKTNINENMEVIIYDASMRRIIQKTFSNATTINTGELANGMYLYTLQGRNGIVKNGKIIKE